MVILSFLSYSYFYSRSGMREKAPMIFYNNYNVKIVCVLNCCMAISSRVIFSFCLTMMTLGLIPHPALHRTTGNRGLVTSNHGNQTPQVCVQSEEGYIAVEFHLNVIFWLPYEFRFSRKQSISRVNRLFIKCRNCALCQGKWHPIRQIFSRHLQRRNRPNYPSWKHSLARSKGKVFLPIGLEKLILRKEQLS